MATGNYAARSITMPCTLLAPCLRTPDTTAVRNVAFFRGRVEPDTLQPRETHTMRIKAPIDSASGREQYGRRFATVEPVFANVRYNKRLDRFTLRGRTKVDGQWKLCCPVHNIEKLANASYGRVASQIAISNTARTHDQILKT